MECIQCSCDLKGKWAYDVSTNRYHPICASTRCLGRRLLWLAHKVEKFRSQKDDNLTLRKRISELEHQLQLNQRKNNLLEEAFGISTEKDVKMMEELISDPPVISKKNSYGKRDREKTEDTFRVPLKKNRDVPEFPMSIPDFSTFWINNATFNFIMPTPESFQTN